ncbi:MAG TPA: 3-deoxy-7-phosphoheptulonate synthase [Gemmatimonadaceae bacterium]|nr:3-deoxy-7-phosphoheptulonate synthase [Gemmatimonadaceae bacterium]
MSAPTSSPDSRPATAGASRLRRPNSTIAAPPSPPQRPLLHATPDRPYPLVAGNGASLPGRESRTIPIRVGDQTVGDPSRLTIIAGPCSVENGAMLERTATHVRDLGASMLRGGAFKPRTSPYAFRGLGAEALELLAEARARTGLPVVTEVMDTRDVELVCTFADVLQIGARNMQNFNLLAEVGSTRHPVLLKRGNSATLHELLMAAEHVMAAGNPNVILCERGIRTFETATRNTLDVSAIPVLKSETHLPVIVDPSHAGGRAALVEPLALAAVAAGADGLIVEVHPDPATALSDGDQSLSFAQFARCMERVSLVAGALGRTITGGTERYPGTARCSA